MLRSYEILRVFGIFGSCMLVAMTVSAADPPLKVGDVAPAIECLEADGQTWNSQILIGKQMLVVFFYPSDFAFCSTRQATRYQQQLSELDKAGVAVVGVSGDQVRTHSLFKATYQLGFPLLADEQGNVARKFCVPLRSGGKAVVKDLRGHEVLDSSGNAIHLERKFTFVRWTFVIDKEGRIANIVTSASPLYDSQESLQRVQLLVGK